MNIHASWRIGALALCLTTFGTQAAIAADAKAASEETAIPFVDMRTSIRNWEADGQDGIWVEDARNHWYYGRLLAPCFGLDFATSVGFVTPGNRLDRFSSLIVPGERQGRCQLNSFVPSEKPLPRKERLAAKKAAEAAAKAEKAAQ